MREALTTFSSLAVLLAITQAFTIDFPIACKSTRESLRVDVEDRRCRLTPASELCAFSPFAEAPPPPRTSFTLCSPSCDLASIYELPPPPSEDDYDDVSTLYSTSLRSFTFDAATGASSSPLTTITVRQTSYSCGQVRVRVRVRRAA